MKKNNRQRHIAKSEIENIERGNKTNNETQGFRGTRDLE